MDHGQGEECYFLVCWFACRDCLRDTVLDGYAIFLFVCLVDGWMDGWMGGWTDGRTDGWMDGCCVSQGGGGAGEGAALRDGRFWLLGLLVAWWVCWLGRVVTWLVSQLVGTPLMDAWMDGCCVNGEGAAPPLQCKPSRNQASPARDF